MKKSAKKTIQTPAPENSGTKNEKPLIVSRMLNISGGVPPVIGKEMAIGEVIKKYPKTNFVFIDYGLHCLGCPMANLESSAGPQQSETVEEAAESHHIDLERLLNDLNKAAGR